MIQDIGAFRYHNEYKKASPTLESFVLCYRGRELLMKKEGDVLSFFTYAEALALCPECSEDYTYLFRIDETTYFWLPGFGKWLSASWEDCIGDEEEPGSADNEAAPDGMKHGTESASMENGAASDCRENRTAPDCALWLPIDSLRGVAQREAAFAGVTGYQLADWYESRRFCPRCGRPMVHDEKERMMRCTACGLLEYPKICPAVIVGVQAGDRLLLTRYAGRSYRRYALIAGFAEIGETIEETVQREVMEEVGLRVKNLRYYKSQPWSFTGTLLMGFFAELDGADAIHLDRMELSEARWCTRDEIPEDDGVSLTREMMRVFKEGRI